MVELTRRGLICGLLAAPAIIAYDRLMPVRKEPFVVRPIEFMGGRLYDFKPRVYWNSSHTISWGHVEDGWWTPEQQERVERALVMEAAKIKSEILTVLKANA